MGGSQGVDWGFGWKEYKLMRMARVGRQTKNNLQMFGVACFSMIKVGTQVVAMPANLTVRKNSVIQLLE